MNMRKEVGEIFSLQYLITLIFPMCMPLTRPSALSCNPLTLLLATIRCNRSSSAPPSPNEICQFLQKRRVVCFSGSYMYLYFPTYNHLINPHALNVFRNTFWQINLKVLTFFIFVNASMSE